MFKKFGILFNDFPDTALFKRYTFNVQYLSEVLKLAEAAVQGERGKALSYVQLLIEKLIRDGDEKAAGRLQRLLSGGSGASVAAANLTLQERLPVDTETRLSLADEVRVDPGDTEVFLSQPVAQVVDEFIRYVTAADQLIAEGLSATSSLLMYGPPGCGKTELAKFIASRLGLPLLTARTDTLISSYLGSTAKNLRFLFDHAAARPCVLFLDEFDAIGKLRDDRHELGELKRVVVSLLQNIDAVNGQSILLAATNHEHLLDPAIWRRFAYRVRIDPPDEQARAAMFRKFLARDLGSAALDRLVTVSAGLTGSDLRLICEAERREMILSGANEISEAGLLRRLLLAISGTDSKPVIEMIAEAKARYPKVFTHRILAEMFDMSPGNVTYILKKLDAQGLGDD